MPRKKKEATLSPAAYPHQAYGQGVDAIQAQKQIPLPNEVANQTPTSTPTPVAVPPPMPENYQPQQVTPLDAPTGKPGEHVMSGAPIGPGPGPEALIPGPGSTNGDVLMQLQALLQMHPNPGLVNLIDSIKSGDYTRGGVYGKMIGQP
jgi:hypothetical protein